MLLPDAISTSSHQEIVRLIENDARALDRFDDGLWISLIERDRPDLGHPGRSLRAFNHSWGTTFASWMEAYYAVDTVDQPPGTLLIPQIDEEIWRVLQEEALFYRDAEEEAEHITWNPHTNTGIVTYRNPGDADRVAQDLQSAGFQTVLIPGTPDPLDFWEGSDEGRFYEP